MTEPKKYKVLGHSFDSTALVDNGPEDDPWGAGYVSGVVLEDGGKLYWTTGHEGEPVFLKATQP